MSGPRPLVLFVGRERHVLPLPVNQARKWDAVGERLVIHVLAACREPQPDVDARFTLYAPASPRALDGAAFYALLPLRVARALRRFRPEVIWVQGVHETFACLVARRLTGSRARIVLDVHGDWHVTTRLYGSPARRLLNPVNDWMATVSVRAADAIRTVSTETTELCRALGVEPAGVFPAYSDFEAFLGPPPAPLPERPVALWVGVLEPTKNTDGLVAAWRAAARRVPGAILHVVGRGSQAGLVERLVAELPEQTRWTPSLPNMEIPAALDAAWLLCMPSRSEGLPRAAVEAVCRGRAVVGGRAGGMPDIVEHERNGLLVDPERPDELADALVRVLSDRALAERLGAAARDGAGRWAVSPAQYADAVTAVVETALRNRP